jgi:hypothetical protein
MMGINQRFPGINPTLRGQTVIDTTVEKLITFSEAARVVPSRHPGRKLATVTVWRWAEYGVQGIKLESVYVGGSRYTSREALQRFAMATTTARQGGTPAPPPSPVGRRQERRERELARTNAEVDAMLNPPPRRRGRRPRVEKGGET